jgi:prepilin-type N-terminal cleavage/methylation domain-containing protein
MQSENMEARWGKMMKSKSDDRGFTLIELMVVIIILGILVGYVGVRVMGKPEEARRTKARVQMETIETALKLYKLDNGVYPSTEQVERGRIFGKGKGSEGPLGKRICLPLSGYSRRL